MKRRGFLFALAALPFIGAYRKPAVAIEPAIMGTASWGPVSDISATWNLAGEDAELLAAGISSIRTSQSEAFESWHRYSAVDPPMYRSAPLLGTAIKENDPIL